MRSIGIAAKVTAPEALEHAMRVAGELRGRGLEVCFDDETAAALDDRGACWSKSSLGTHTDLLITFGGDGTLLSVARHAPSHVPILGVNMGTLGFLTEIRLEELPGVLDRVLAGDFQSEERVALEVTVQGPDDSDRVYRVLNDVAINKS